MDHTMHRWGRKGAVKGKGYQLGNETFALPSAAGVAVGSTACQLDKTQVSVLFLNGAQ